MKLYHSFPCSCVAEKGMEELAPILKERGFEKGEHYTFSGTDLTINPGTYETLIAIAEVLKKYTKSS